jgi:hypothetical protein
MVELKNYFSLRRRNFIQERDNNYLDGNPISLIEHKTYFYWQCGLESGIVIKYYPKPENSLLQLNKEESVAAFDLNQVMIAATKKFGNKIKTNVILVYDTIEERFICNTLNKRFSDYQPAILQMQLSKIENSLPKHQVIVNKHFIHE